MTIFQKLTFMTRFGLFSILILLTFSCGMKKKPYEFIVKNNTALKINKFEIAESSKNPITLAIEPLGISEIVSREYSKNCICFDAPGTSISVREYTDSLGVHEHLVGIWVPIQTLSAKRINTININIDPAASTPTNVFDISVD